MAVDTARPTGLARVTEFGRSLPERYSEVKAEMAKVTWPDRQQIRQLSIGVIILTLFIGGVIAIMDVVFQQIFVRWIPTLFGG